MRETNVLIVEDEELFASKMEMQVEKLGYKCIGIVDNSEDALNKIDQKMPQLVIMDINIAGEHDGIELAEIIQSKQDVAILFVTSNHDDLSFNRATRLETAGYITKPFTDIQLQRAIELAVKQSHQQSEEMNASPPVIKDGVLFIRKGNEIKRVMVDDIFYLEADGRYTRVYVNAEVFLLRNSLKQTMDIFPSDQFFQVHRSYIVNLSKIKSVNLEDNLILLEERSVPLSRREKDRLLERLNYI